MGRALPVELMWKARQMYEEKWTEEDAKQHPVRAGERKWSQMAIAKHLGISETSVLRAVNNLGRFGNFKNAPLPTTKTDEELNEGAAASLQKLLGMIAEEKKEMTPGQTTADNLLNEFENLKRKPDGNG